MVRGVRPLAADLLNPGSVREALAGLDVTHVFICTWLRQETEAENVKVNGAMVEPVRRAGGSSKADACSAGDWDQAVPRTIRGIWPGFCRDAVSGRPSAAAGL
jgi:hypothetical protein